MSPASSRPTISSVVATGRRMNGSEMLTGLAGALVGGRRRRRAARAARRRPGSGARAGLDGCDLAARAQLVLPLDDDLLAAVEALARSPPGRRRSARPRPASSRAVWSVADDVDERALRAALHRDRRHDQRALRASSTSMRALTNSFGHSARFGFGTSALSRSVAVVWLIWLSITASCPSRAAVVPSRL